MGPGGQDAGHIEFIDALDGFATAGRGLVGSGAVGGQQHARQGQLCLPESLTAFFHGGADAGGPLLLDLLGQVAVKAVGGSAGKGVSRTKSSRQATSSSRSPGKPAMMSAPSPMTGQWACRRPTARWSISAV